MLDDLRFVQGAVAKKDLVPAMTHFAIERGEVRAYNGMIALSSPIPFDIDCKPKAESLVRAIGNCPDTIQLSMTEGGRLRVQSGAFRALVECVHEETPHVLPEGAHVEFDGAAVLNALRTVTPFIGDDASRPWASGVLLSGGSAFATNNITLVEYWIGAMFPAVVNIPRVAVREMLRIGEPPLSAQICERSATFHYTNGRWLRTQLLDCAWPDFTRILDADPPPNPVALPDGIFDAIDAVEDFTDKLNRIHFRDGQVRTHAENDEEGAAFDVPGLTFEGTYSAKMFGLLKGIATSADMTCYPKPCRFYGERLRGAIIGMR